MLLNENKEIDFKIFQEIFGPESITIDVTFYFIENKMAADFDTPTYAVKAVRRK